MRALRIGLVYETFETYPRRASDPADAHVEFEPESTIEALESAIAHLGHRAIRMGSPRALLDRLAGDAPLDVDAAFNLAEGQGGRNREAWAPVLLELAGIPTLGSDALTLSLSLDKAWTNRFLASQGMPIAAQTTLASASDARQATLPAPFPLFVKPRWEGTAKGIRRTSRVASLEALAAEVDRIVADYGQPALVEAFVPGPEYTVTLVGNGPPRVLPVLQRALERETGIGLHALQPTATRPVRPASRAAARAAACETADTPGVLDAPLEAVTPGVLDAPLEAVTPGVLDAELEARLGALALRAFEGLECRDFARVDFRLDARGEPVFLEINPLPTFATDGSFGILAELEGISLDEMLGRCLTAGLERLGLAGVARSGGRAGKEALAAARTVGAGGRGRGDGSGRHA
jgi:D-alanine-D-alanine ligase